MLDCAGQVFLDRAIGDSQAFRNLPVGQPLYARQQEDLLSAHRKFRNCLPDGGQFAPAPDGAFGRGLFAGNAGQFAIGNAVGLLAVFPAQMVDGQVVRRTIEVRAFMGNDCCRIVAPILGETQKSLLSQIGCRFRIAELSCEISL